MEMSCNINNINSGVVYANNSFERFGDDLCELVLSYLPLIEKFKYESVSKQWQTLIFNKQFKLIIDRFDGIYSLEKLINNNLLETKYFNIFTINANIFECLLRKCFNINSIEFNWKCICDENALQLMTKYCLHLRRITISSAEGFDLSDALLSQFGQTCGQKLHYFGTHVNFNGNLKLLLKYCHNLRSIYALNDSQQLIDCNQLFLPNLQEMDFLVTEDSHLSSLELLVDKYGNKMRKLNINIKIGETNNQVISSDINQILKQLSRFVKLEYLRINMNSYFGQTFGDGLRMIGQNCTKLKYFDFESYDTIILENVFQLFENYTTLEYFSLHCRYLYRYESFQSVDQFVNYGQIKCFNKCKNLLYLKLNLLHLNDDNLDDINIYFPKLKLIELKSTKNLTNRSLNSIAKLKALKSLRVCCSEKITNSCIFNLVNSCPLLNNIYFDGNPNINELIINALITNANLRNKIHYKLYYSGIPIKFENCIPTNLCISNFWDKQWY